jgi:hypothetical protein
MAVRHLLRYRTRPEGLDPGPMLHPLRSEPVQRDEVRFEFTYHQGRDRARVYVLGTMPLGTFRREERPQRWPSRWLVADADLWQPVLDEVALELAADFAQFVRWYEEQPTLWSKPRQTRLEPLELSENNSRIYACEHCGRGYVGVKLRGNQRVCICSNRCERARHNAVQRQWRQHFGQSANSMRTTRRAAARAGLVCEHCGQSFEAARSTRRFCSDICRVRWHRANP